MKVLITGGSGFFGNYLRRSFGDQAISLGRSTENEIVADLSKSVPVLPAVDLVIHSAGKAHIVPKNKQEVQMFYDVNVKGTENLLEGIDRIKPLPKTIVFMSTVAVYGLVTGVGISEMSPLLAESPYGKSKILAEKLISDWSEKSGVSYVILRLPLIVGNQNPPGNLGAMIRAISKGFYFRLGKGDSRKSMVLAEDVALLIPRLFGKEGIYNLTDGSHPSLSELDEYIAGLYHRKIWEVPMSMIKPLCTIGDILPFFPINSYRFNKLISNLIFDDSKAVSELDWKPRPIVGNFLIEK